ncbi:MAG TPA: DUF3618 domain-containing protein [Streptosporangiaceae bacterium]|nr:DUF3618 domain-containing protein [Streptosporangiaceae bacterium]
MADADIEPKPANQSQDALVADIERTREELARTIDAISDRVNPANAARRTMDQVKERIAATDPVLAGGVAVAVAGTVAAWFLLRRRNKK